MKRLFHIRIIKEGKKCGGLHFKFKPPHLDVDRVGRIWRGESELEKGFKLKVKNWFWSKTKE